MKRQIPMLKKLAAAATIALVALFPLTAPAQEAEATTQGRNHRFRLGPADAAVRSPNTPPSPARIARPSTPMSGRS
jgi:hypothetical protein